MLSRLASFQRRSFLKGKVAENIFRKGLFVFAYSRNGLRVKARLAAFPSSVHYQITHRET